MSDSHFEPAFIIGLLALSSLDQQVGALAAAGLLQHEGLSRLLDSAARLVHSDPGQAQQLAVLCADVAEQAGGSTVVPRAIYIQAQAHAINGQFNMARALIEAARSGYEAIGEHLEALRTNLGLMHVLGELGDYRAALDAGQALLDALQEEGYVQGDASSPHLTLLAAIAYQNRGICYRHMGRYQETLDVYASAEVCFRALDMTEHVGHIQVNRGVVLLGLGRGSEALAAFEAAAALQADADHNLVYAQTLINIG
ncbi:MAG: tetratricopeptide repeat protein, partial [Ardenticatenaceae bacterium]